jgi:hypothetical protein
MEEHYPKLKKLIEGMRYGETVGYYLGELDGQQEKNVVKMIRKIAKKNLIEIHIRWSVDKQTVKITEVF